MQIDQVFSAILLGGILLLITLYFTGRFRLRKKAIARRSCHYCKSFDASRGKIPEAAQKPGLVLAEHTVQALEQETEEGPCGMQPVGSPHPAGPPRTIELVSDFWSARRKKMRILGSVQEIGYCELHCRRVARTSSCEKYTPVDGE